jgi:hypothetical protein
MAAVLEREFHSAMLRIYTKASAGYNASRFLAMVSEMGGVDAARTLLRSAHVSEGYTALWERGHLELTVEALMLEPRWRPLFTPEERDIARKRLLEYRYSGPLPPEVE